MTKINDKTKKINDNDNIDTESILFNIHIIYEHFNIYEKDGVYMSLIINESGNIELKTSFHYLYEINSEMLFELINVIVNPIIKELNVRLKNTDNKLLLISKYNTDIQNSNIHLFWNNEITSKGFSVLLSKFSNHIASGILNIRSDNHIYNEIEYSINRGMTNFNDKSINKYLLFASNYFAYLSNGDLKSAWSKVYLNSKIISIRNKMNNLRIELSNITEQELLYMSRLIYNILYKYKKDILISDPDSDISPLKFLKRSDPKLYTIRDPKTGKDMYSRKCQKKSQPVIVSKTFINNENKNSVTKFWNFTKNKDEYYYCPNKQFPFVKFLTNIHPNNYCVPCCKKKEESMKVDSKTNTIHNKCLETHMYNIDDIDIDNKTRYIMSYGKQLEYNRIMTLPNELQTIINNDITDNYEQYYLFGLHHHGVLNILADVNDIHIHDYLKKVIIFLKGNSNIFQYLMNGSLIYNFNNIDELCIVITNMFIHNKMCINNSFKLWNELFINISKYMNLNVIVYEDIGSIEMKIPINTKYITDIFPVRSNYIIVLKKEIELSNYAYYPVYFINGKTHFKTQVISKKIFDSDDRIIINIKKVYNYYLNSRPSTVNAFDLINIYNFLEYYNNNNKLKYSISKYYINNKLKCYGLLLNYNNNHIHISIQESNIDTDDNTIKHNLSFDIINMKKTVIKIKNIFNFISDYNDFIYHSLQTENTFSTDADKMIMTDIKMYNRESDITFNFDIITNYKYSFLRIFRFIQFNNDIIGVECNNLHFYFNPYINTKSSMDIIKTNILSLKNDIYKSGSSLKPILTRIFDLHKNEYSYTDIHKLYIKTLIYDPQVINKVLINNERTIKDARVINRNRGLYNTFLYQLVILQFQKEFSTYQNTKLRSTLKNCINNLTPSELNNKYFKTKNNKIYCVLEKYYSSMSNIEYRDDLSISYQAIYKILLFYLNKGVMTNREIKKLIIEEFDNIKFQFDKIFITKFKAMGREELTTELTTISKNLFTINNTEFIDPEFRFPNILLPCKEDSSSIYCNKNKLLISKKNLEMYLGIITNDIHNSLKSNYIFSTFFIDNNVNKFTFKNFINEKILIN